MGAIKLTPTEGMSKKGNLGFDLDELFDEYDTNTLSVSDFNIVINGIRVDYIHKKDNGDIGIWAGNPDTDKYAEELLLSREEKREILELIWEYMS